MSRKSIILIISALLAVFVLIGTAVATLPSGQTVTLLGRARFGRGLDEQHNNVVVQKKLGSADFATVEVTFDPGGSSGWHHHPGVGLVTVTSGSLTKYDANCEHHTYSAGEAFVESDSRPALVRTEGSEEAVVVATFVIPSRTDEMGLRIDDPQPEGCDVS